ncbi:putative efflux pump antibiotic resistance protein [Phaeomoniella chlamydospora]|uniref:Putative efflux pump antibiotic resistance protein n=1 Tax=Phaeomoniella chlamydospora TaxID=158046 RepID=A0A0G2EUB6_PHACM|nr:putative efflux pump antibiotic resistance protein [Phaeomoniella chlamydospora]
MTAEDTHSNHAESEIGSAPPASATTTTAGSYGAIDQKSAAKYTEGSVDEGQPLLERLPPDDRTGHASTSIIAVISVLILGEFLASADHTLIFAAGPTISSTFNNLEDVNWLSTAYILGIGKISDIYGRKSVLLFCYLFFGLGNVICGVGKSMVMVIIGRSISGIGGADLVPRRDVAFWRAYVNLALTLGRSLGGPVGGLLTDTLGWRWMFLLQAPLVILASLLVSFRLRLPQKSDENSKAPAFSKFRRIDFLGSGLLAISTITGMILLDMGGEKFPWKSWQTAWFGAFSIVSFISFIVIEAFVASEPIFSLHLLKKKDVVLSYMISTFQIVAQVSMMFSVPLYFQITAGASTTVSGAHLVPAVVGNAVGGILAGSIIKRTGRYKFLAVSSGIVASIAYALLLARWRGHTGLLESLYIFPGGLGTGIVQSVVFISMTAALEHKEIAMGTSGLFQLLNVGLVVGITGSSSILKTVFREQLLRNITGPGSEEIIEKALSDASFIQSLTGKLHEIVVSCYVTGLQHTYVLSLVATTLGFLASLCLSNRQL